MWGPIKESAGDAVRQKLTLGSGLKADIGERAVT